MIDKLAISPDGTILLVLARNLLENSQLGLFYPAVVDATQSEESFVPSDHVVWNDPEERIPSLAAFSADGSKIAIITSRSGQEYSELRLLRKRRERWVRCRELLIPVCSSHEQGQIEVEGVTGITM